MNRSPRSPMLAAALRLAAPTRITMHITEFAAAAAPSLGSYRICTMPAATSFDLGHDARVALVLGRRLRVRLKAVEHLAHDGVLQHALDLGVSHGLLALLHLGLGHLATVTAAMASTQRRRPSCASASAGPP